MSRQFTTPSALSPQNSRRSLVAPPRQDLSEVTAASDVIFTVVTDDNAMRQIFAGFRENLLVNARGKLSNVFFKRLIIVLLCFQHLVQAPCCPKLP